MARRNRLVSALLGLLASTTIACAAEPDVPPPADTTTAVTRPDPSPGKPVAVAQSCVSECQAQHDRCRVATKGSRICDDERQRCLEICLQKKKR